MENKRAKYLIEKGDLTGEDKEFLLIHLDMYEQAMQSLNVEVLSLKDVIDYNNALNNNVLTIKENISNLEDCEDKQKILRNFASILEYINALDGKPDN